MRTSLAAIELNQLNYKSRTTNHVSSMARFEEFRKETGDRIQNSECLIKEIKNQNQSFESNHLLYNVDH